jgi:hypothetical protein
VENEDLDGNQKLIEDYDSKVMLWIERYLARAEILWCVSGAPKLGRNTKHEIPLLKIDIKLI